MICCKVWHHFTYNCQLHCIVDLIEATQYTVRTSLFDCCGCFTTVHKEIARVIIHKYGENMVCQHLYTCGWYNMLVPHAQPIVPRALMKMWSAHSSTQHVSTGNTQLTSSLSAVTTSSTLSLPFLTTDSHCVNTFPPSPDTAHSSPPSTAPQSEWDSNCWLLPMTSTT